MLTTQNNYNNIVQHHQGPKVTETKTLEKGNSVDIFIANKKNYIHLNVQNVHISACSGEGREGPLFDVCGALWVPLQRLHHLTVFQHQPHQLILALNFTRARVHGTHQLQLQQMLKRLKHTHARTSQTYAHTHAHTHITDTHTHNTGEH